MDLTKLQPIHRQTIQIMKSLGASDEAMQEVYDKCKLLKTKK